MGKDTKKLIITNFGKLLKFAKVCVVIIFAQLLFCRKTFYL